MITCGTQVVSGSSGGGASLPDDPATVLLDAGAPSTMLGLNSSGVGEALSAAAARSRMALGSLATQSSVTASQISDSTTAGRTLVTAADAAAQRTALGVVATPNTTPSNIIAGATAGAALITDASGAAQAITGTSGYVLTSNGAGVAPTWQAGGGGGSTWLSLYGGSALWMGGDAAFGWSSSDRVSASAGAAVPAWGPGQSLVIVLYPGATPTGTELIAAHISVGSGRGWYVSVGTNAGARRRVAIFLAGLNASADLYLTGSDFTVGAPYVLAITIKADKSVRYSVNGGTVQTIAALSGTYVAPTSADVLRVGALTEYAPSYYPPTSVLVGALRCYSTELSDADLVAACAGASTASIPTVATGTVSAAFSAAAFAGGVRVVAASPTPTWIAAGNPAIRGV